MEAPLFHRHGKKEKSISKKISSNAAADLILSTLQGGIQLARMRNENNSFKIILHKLLIAYLSNK